MKIIYNTATTLNGFLATEDDSLQWLFDVGGQEPDMDAFLDSISVIVMGSTTYEWLLREMDLLNRPEKWREYYGDRTGFVFSSRELPVPAGVDIRVVNGTVPEILPEVRTAAGDSDVWVLGGGDLAGQFLDEDLLDEIVLTMAPVFLPAGRPLLPREVLSDRLHLRETRRTGRYVEVMLGVVKRGEPGQP
ncbi:dihydrofolate reductase family protein [Corynebacterium halotolerans]|uniref:Dihydrofolate reductase n=1 Tax=Corynebacterium halotolerans YIM 70093 = DSM 44683 TaxID=1121362 RepID=M1MVF3_9CORY|nr:dihydrofolate reductase family protein [Corynebacterium halotolerans]AGF71704.1 dihydrofolate reductase [Corynebacterium halotolerans YIM 70093 = DSM 44683]